jgi:hypothetical protein
MTDGKQVRSILITGSSSGIGEACTIALDRAGFQVFAGVRREVDAERLRLQASERMTPVILNVTDAKSITAAASRLIVERTLVRNPSRYRPQFRRLDFGLSVSLDRALDRPHASAPGAWFVIGVPTEIHPTRDAALGQAHAEISVECRDSPMFSPCECEKENKSECLT